MTPASKLNYLRKRASIDILDSINDAPILARAHLSIALSRGTDIAKSSADMVLFSDKLLLIISARKLALYTRNIIRENMAWALGYNLIILPLAISGFVAPYIAAIRMPASSLIVVSNCFFCLAIVFFIGRTY